MTANNEDIIRIRETHPQFFEKIHMALDANGRGILEKEHSENNEATIILHSGVYDKFMSSFIELLRIRKTDTYWTQEDGLAVVGELTGMKLKPISIDTVVWRDWKIAHPDSEVLSTDTGFSRAYGRDPYGNYYEDSFLMFPVENEDDRVHPKTVVFGIAVNGKYRAYKEDDLFKNRVIEDSVDGVPIRVTRSKDGIVRIENLESGEEIVKERDFWFAWYAFHPDTTLYER